MILNFFTSFFHIHKKELKENSVLSYETQKMLYKFHYLVFQSQWLVHHKSIRVKKAFMQFSFFFCYPPYHDKNSFNEDEYFHINSFFLFDSQFTVAFTNDSVAEYLVSQRCLLCISVQTFWMVNGHIMNNHPLRIRPNTIW